MGPRLEVRNGNGSNGTPRLGRPARFIAVAGNIGAGKSTLTAFLESRYQIQPFYEPNDANPYLADFYRDMGRYAFHSQMYFLAAKFRAHLQLKAALEATPGAIFAQDRTIYEDAEIFCHTLWRTGVMSSRDHSVYMGMYEAIRDSLPKPDLLIFLRCSLRGIRRRIRHRGRVEEQNLDTDYLRGLQRAYANWYQRYELGPSLVIETERLHYLDDLFHHTELMAALDSVLRPEPNAGDRPGSAARAEGRLTTGAIAGVAAPVVVPVPPFG